MNKKLLAIIFDLFAFLAIYFYVESLTFDFEIAHIVDESLFIMFPIIAIMKVVINLLFKLYDRIWSMASIEEITVIAHSFLVSNAIVLIMVVTNILHISFITFIAAMFLELLAYILSRFYMRYFNFYAGKRALDKSLTRTLIIGAGMAGDLAYRELVSHRELYKMVVVGFLDDDLKKVGKHFKNLPIFGPSSNLESVIKSKKIEEVIIAVPSMKESKKNKLIEKLVNVNVKSRIFTRLSNSADSPYGIRDIEITDLLGRDTIQLDDDGIENYYKGKTVLVTGGGGSIGSEICRQLMKYSVKKVIVFDIYENNAYDLQMEVLSTLKADPSNETEFEALIGSVRDKERLCEVFTSHDIDVVFHAAAHKHVPLMEDSPFEAVKNNIYGTFNVATTATEFNVDKFVLISTDKAVNPTNIMGASKRFAEIIIQNIDQKSKTQFSAVRFGNVLGSNGSVIPLFKKQIEKRGPVTVTHKDIIRYFMTIPEACQLVLQSGVFSSGGEIFVLDMGEPVKILDMAEKMIKLYGLTPYKDIDIEFTGLRPGEKMFEELLISKNGQYETENKRIFIEKNGLVDVDLESYMNEIMKDINKLKDISDFIETEH